jgi:glutamine synthetase
MARANAPKVVPAVEKDNEYVLRTVADHNIKFIGLWFTDILGFQKSCDIDAEELPKALTEGLGFDGSSIEGFARIEESDVILRPDPTTFAILPWRHGEDVAMARMMCDVHLPDGRPYPGDPRHALKRNLKRAADMGFTFYVGPELEYFYFRRAQGNPECLDEMGYYDQVPPDIGSDLRRETALALDKMGIGVEYSHHEVAPSQHEIDLRYSDALTMADRVMSYRYAVKEVAARHDVYATFMPKPIFGQNGSGMHVHMSLFKGSRNAFFNARDKYHLSLVAKQFIAGLLRHASEMAAVTNQWVNSYKRLVPGYEAPAYISWGHRNRSALVRVPMYKPGKESGTRIEYRAPDPACNPYLAFSVMLAAGLKGIDRRYKLVPPVEDNVYEMDIAMHKDRGIASLPGNLHDAILLAEQSEVVREALGEHVFSKFITNKKIEWDRYRIQVTHYEIDRYLPIL